MSYTPLASQSYNAELHADLFASLFLNYPQFFKTTNFFDGVVNGQVIAIAGDTDDITGGDACNTTETGTGNLVFESVTLNPYAYLVNKPNCWNDLKRDPLFLEKFSRTKPRDLVANPEFADYVATFYKNGMVEDMLRYMYLGDTTAVIASSGGILRNGLSGNTVKYTRVDGFWKQIIDAGSAIARVTISENALTTAATQFSGLTGAEILAYLLDGLSKMDARVYHSTERPMFILITDWMYRTLTNYYQTTALTAGGLTGELLNGIMQMRVNGVPLVPMPFWDRNIGTNTITGDTVGPTSTDTGRYLPHRFIITNDSTLIVGSSYDPMTPVFDLEYNPNTRAVNFVSQIQFDQKLGKKAFMVVGY